MDVLGSMFEKPIGPLGYDLDHAQVIVSFGVPLCDCWGTPARTARYLGKKFEGKQKLLQIEAYRSRTSEMADRWIPIRPGTDAAFALGMAHVILKEKLSQAKSKDLSEFESIVSTFSPSVVAEVCGVSEDTIVETARVFSMSKPSVAVIDGLTNSREAQAAVMILNLLVGNVGWKGGVAVRREVPTGLADIKNTESINSDMYSIPDHSIRVMLIDESLSGCQLSDTLLQKKLAENGIVVSLSPFVTERPFCAQYVIPTPVFLESLTDLSSPHDSESSSMSISFPLVPSPTGVVDPIYFIQRLASAAGVVNIESGTMEELVKRRAGVLYGEKRGTVFNASTGQLSGVRNLLSTDDMWNALITGGCWIDSAEIVKSFPAFRLSAFLSKVDINKLQSGKNQLVLVPFIEKTVYSNSEISPLMSKVGQESGLRPFGCRAYLNPTTAEVIGIHEGCRIVLQTNKGSMEAEARYDASIMPGIVGVSNTTHPQNFIALCEMNDNAAICPTPVKIQKV